MIAFLSRLVLVMLLAVPGWPAASDWGRFEGISPLISAREMAQEPVLPPQKSNAAGLVLFHTRLETYLRDNVAHAQMTALLNDPRMERLSAEFRQRLRADGAGLTAARDGMMPEAAGLDSEDTALAAQRDQLEANKRSLDARLANIDQQVAQHNAACSPTHPPERHDWCVDNARRLKELIARYNADVKTHNAAVDKWRSDVASLQSRWDPFVQRILAWESKVKALVEETKNAFNEICEPLSAVALDPASPPPLEAGGKQQAFQAVVSFSTLGLAPSPCPIDVKWLLEGGRIGSLVPDSSDPKRALLTSGEEEEDGFVAAEVVDRKNNKKIKAAVAVKVRKKDQDETRIRIQAQGHDMPTPGGKSVKINVAGFLYLSQGKKLLGQLWDMLTPDERTVRRIALTETTRFMDNAAAAGGTGPTSRTFRDDPTSDIRIDVQVFAGRAFVLDPAAQ